MATKRVSEARGNELLELVFDVVITQMKDHAVVIDETTGEEVKAFTATPALLTFAGKLLKDNSITLQADEAEGRLNAVEQELANRKKHSRLASVSYLNKEAVND